MKRKTINDNNNIQQIPIERDTDSWSTSDIPKHILNCTELITMLETCAQHWFNEQLNNAFDLTKSTNTRRRIAYNRKHTTNRTSQQEEVWINSRNIWAQTDMIILRPICNSLRVDTEDGRRYTFQQKKNCGKDSLDPFLTAQTRVALNGGCIQSTHVHSWTRSGGGIWSHVCTGAGLRIAFFVYEAIKSFLGISLYSSALPYIVFKPVGGTKEHAQFHTFSPTQLYKHLQDHNSHVEGSSIRRWMVDHGVHTTAHLRGGSTMFTIGPMTPWRLFLCLSIVHPSHFHTDIRHLSPTWWNRKQKNSTYHVAFDDIQNLQIINRILYYFEDNGTTPLTYTADVQWLSRFQTSTAYQIITQSIPRSGRVFVPLCVQSVIKKSTNGQIVLCANGFPYGYVANKQHSRVSIRIPLSKKRPPINMQLFEHLYHVVHNTTEWLNVPKHANIPYTTITQTSRFLRHLYYMVRANMKPDKETYAWLKNNTLYYKSDNIDICPLKMNELVLKGPFGPVFPSLHDLSMFLKQYQ
jgi:hypothetical protein